MQGLKGLLTPFALGFSPHVERNSGFDLILRADTVNTRNRHPKPATPSKSGFMGEF
jgi:hypothetical protein